MTEPGAADAAVAGAVSAARAVAAETAHTFADAFGDRLTAVYLLGSLAYGGYAPAVSDIDLAVVLADRRPADPATVTAIVDRLRGQSALHAKLSVFWGSLPALREGRDDGRFPAIDRVQLAGQGRLLLGDAVADQMAGASDRDLLLESAGFAAGLLASDEVVGEFHQPRRLLKDAVWFTKAVLFPVRFLRGASTTNDEAIDWYLGRPGRTGEDLVRLAARVRAGAPLEPAEAEPALAAGLAPLYRVYIDDHLVRLRRTAAPADLVTAFIRWRERLPA